MNVFVDAAARCGVAILEHEHEVNSHAIRIERIGSVARTNNNGVEHSVTVLAWDDVRAMEETAIRNYAHGATRVAAEGGEQCQFPLRRIWALDIGTPDVTARIANNNAVRKTVTIRIRCGERRRNTVDELRVLEYRC